MNILVTGADGQLGKCFRQIAPQFEQHRFYFTDLTELDITNPNAVNDFFRQNLPDVVFNCAAYTAVDKAEEDISKAFLVNSQAVANLVSACREFGSAFIHYSTDYVFDGKKSTPYLETDPVNPVGVYGISKLEGEKLALSYERGTVLRTAWVYSEFGNNFVKTMRKYGAERESLSVVFDQTGTPTAAADLAAATLQILEPMIGNSSFGLYHYSNEGVLSWYDFAVAIMELSNLSCKIQPIRTAQYPTPAKRPEYSVLDKTKFKQTFNLQIPYWKNSLAEVIVRLEKQNS